VSSTPPPLFSTGTPASLRKLIEPHTPVA